MHCQSSGTAHAAGQQCVTGLCTAACAPGEMPASTCKCEVMRECVGVSAQFVPTFVLIDHCLFCAALRGSI